MIAIAAHAAVPFWSVPLTFQTRLAAMFGAEKALAVGLAPFLLGEGL